MSKVVRYKISKASLHTQTTTTHTHNFLAFPLLLLCAILFLIGWILVNIPSKEAKQMESKKE